MPKIQDTKMPEKYGSKSSFSRDKKYANSSADIEHNAENVNKYKEMRHEERQRNLEVANGQEPKARPKDSKSRPKDTKSRPQEPKVLAKPEPKPVISCECGTPGLFAWFSPEGEKLILCDDCYADRE
jgi:hypothetical protein